MKTEEIIVKLRDGIIKYINQLAESNPNIQFFKPIICRIVKNIKIPFTDKISLLADSNGEIDFEQLLNEMLNNVINSNPFIIKTSSLGDIEIGNGCIKMIIPYLNKRMILNTEDLKILRDLIIG